METHQDSCMLRPSYLSQQCGDDVQRGLMDGLVLKWRSQSHVHKRSDLLQHHIPATRVVQDLAVLVDLFLEETREFKETFVMLCWPDISDGQWHTTWVMLSDCCHDNQLRRVKLIGESFEGRNA